MATATDPALLTWARAVLARIGAPVTQANLNFLSEWASAVPSVSGNVDAAVANLKQPTNARSYLSLLQGQGRPSLPAGGFMGSGVGVWDQITASIAGFTLIARDPGKALSEGFGAENTAARHIPGVAQTEDVVHSVGKFVAWLTDPGHILRAAQVAAGGVLILAGLVLLARQIGLAAPAPPVAGAVAEAVG